MYHLISYDLKNPGRNYQSLIDAIQQFECFHVNGSCWILYSNYPAWQIRNFLAPHIDKTDNLLVCDFHTWSSYNLNAHFMRWMRK